MPSRCARPAGRSAARVHRRGQVGRGRRRGRARETISAALSVTDCTSGADDDRRFAGVEGDRSLFAGDPGVEVGTHDSPQAQAPAEPPGPVNNTPAASKGRRDQTRRMHPAMMPQRGALWTALVSTVWSPIPPVKGLPAAARTVPVDGRWGDRVAETAPLRVQLIARTEFLAPPMSHGTPTPRAVSSRSSPGEPATRAGPNQPAHRHQRLPTSSIIDVGRFAVLEHASVSFYITGVSRSCAHELVGTGTSPSPALPALRPRGRRLSGDPAGLEDDPELGDRAGRRRPPAARPTSTCWPNFRGQARRPAERRAAPSRPAGRQAVLPNDTETRIVVTGNYRAWRRSHRDAGQRARADVEIRRLAIACLREAGRRGAGGVRRLRDHRAGRRHGVATSPLATDV